MYRQPPFPLPPDELQACVAAASGKISMLEEAAEEAEVARELQLAETQAKISDLKVCVHGYSLKCAQCVCVCVSVFFGGGG